MDMQTDEQEFADLVRSAYEWAEATPWDVGPEQIRGGRRHRVVALPEPKVIALVAAAVALFAFGIFYFRPSPSRTTAPPVSSTTTSPMGSVAVPNVVGLMQAQAALALGSAGLAVGTITSASSTTFAAGTVIGSNPPGGTSLTQGTAVDLTVSTGPDGTAHSADTTVPSTTPVTRPVPSGQSDPGPAAPATVCSAGNQSITVDVSSAATCVRTGASLTVTFVSQGWWSGYGAWSSAAPMISNGSVLEGLSYAPSGTSATAVFRAVAPGSSVVTAQFDVGCAPADTTPCTVPPAAFETVDVTVTG
jgi:hypothetical protein